MEVIVHVLQRTAVLGAVLAASAVGVAVTAGSAAADTGDRGNGLGSTGDLVSGLAGGAGTLGFLPPSPNGPGANFVNGLISNPAAAITGTPNSILPYGLLDGGKPQPL